MTPETADRIARALEGIEITLRRMVEDKLPLNAPATPIRTISLECPKCLWDRATVRPLNGQLVARCDACQRFVKNVSPKELQP